MFLLIKKFLRSVGAQASKARSLISNYHGEASDSAIDDAEGIEHGFAWRGVGSA